MDSGQPYNCPDTKINPIPNEMDKFYINLVETFIVAIGYFPRTDHERISHFLRAVAVGRGF